MDNLGNALVRKAAVSKVLVTGAQGYLGAKIVSQLRHHGAHPVLTGRRVAENIHVCDLLNKSNVHKLLNLVTPDLIIHCAAYVPERFEDYNDDATARKNLTMIKNLLSVSSCPFIYISSMTVYGSGGRFPKHESEAGDPSTAYGCSKWEGEQLFKDAKIPAIAIRIPGLFGPPRMKGLVVNLIKALKKGEAHKLPDSPILWAAMHVDDAARSIVHLAFVEMDGFIPVNVGYSDSYSITQLVELAADIYDCKIRYDVRHPNFLFNLARCESFGALPERDLRSALIEMGEKL